MTQNSISLQIKSLIQYLKNPSFITKDSTKISLFFWFLLVLSANFIAVILGIVSGLVLNQIQYKGENQVLDTIINTPIWFFLILAVVQAPLTEELSFRLILNPSKIKLALALFGFSFYFLTILNSFGLIYSYPFLPFLPILFTNLINSLGLGVVLYLILRSDNYIYQRIFEYIKTNFLWFFYGSSLLFGLIHIQNFSDLEFFKNYFWLLPVLVLPQTFVGVVLAYIRVRNGIKWSILAHGLYNFITSLPFIVLSILPRTTLEAILKGSSNNQIEDKIKNLSLAEKTLLGISGLTTICVVSLGFCCLLFLIYKYYKKSDIQVAK